MQREDHAPNPYSWHRTPINGKIGTIAIAYNPTYIGLKPNREEQQNRGVDNQKLDPFGI
jgi:hypothetical protein